MDLTAGLNAAADHNLGHQLFVPCLSCEERPTGERQPVSQALPGRHAAYEQVHCLAHSCGPGPRAGLAVAGWMVCLGPHRLMQCHCQPCKSAWDPPQHSHQAKLTHCWHDVVPGIKRVAVMWPIATAMCTCDMHFCTSHSASACLAAVSAPGTQHLCTMSQRVHW